MRLQRKHAYFCLGFHAFNRSPLSKLGAFSWAERSSHKLVDKEAKLIGAALLLLLFVGWQQLTWRIRKVIPGT